MCDRRVRFLWQQIGIGGMTPDGYAEPRAKRWQARLVVVMAVGEKHRDRTQILECFDDRVSWPRCVHQ